MKSKCNWKRCIGCQVYRRRKLNKQLICIRRSFEELCAILNHGWRC